MIRFLLTILCFVYSETSFSAAKVLDTRISNTNIDGSLWLELIIDNNTSEALCVDNRMVGLDGELSTSIFTVSRDGTNLDYRGVHASRVEGYVPNHVVLLPQQVVKVMLDLTPYYDFSKKGIYKIQHRTFSGSECFKKFQLLELISNEITVSISEKLSKK